MKRNEHRNTVLFPAGDDLPLFSGACQRVAASPYRPVERAGEQARLPGVETAPEMKSATPTGYLCDDCGKPCELFAIEGPRFPHVSACCHALWHTELVSHA